MRTYHFYYVSRATTLNSANTKLVPSPRAYARNGASRRWLGDNNSGQCLENLFPYITFTRVTPTVTHIDLSCDSIMQGLMKLKNNNACEPDSITPRLLKSAGHAVIPSLFSLYSLSASYNTVPSTWKFGRVSALFKKDDETDKQNYRPVSLLCVPAKHLETQVVSTITNHVEHHNLRNKHQWAYKKGHSTQLLLAKMTEGWRSALDRKLIVGVLFIDFCKVVELSTSQHSAVQTSKLGNCR